MPETAAPDASWDSAFKGELIRPGDASYESARAVFNGMIDKRPTLIARPSVARDVADAIAYARRHDLPLAVRCGGHSVAGTSATDGGVLVDLRSLKGVRVDPVTRTARCNGGVLWGEFDREAQAFGLATPGGRMTTTGVGGFTLGGGYGWLSPVYGLACDNLVAADVVTADGDIVTASEDVNPDLFWALRGGGGNFGVVTSFQFRLHPVGPMVRAGLLAYPGDQAESVIRAYRDVVEEAPDALVTALGMVLAPPAPFVPADLVGSPILGIFVVYVGDPDDGAARIRPLRTLGDLKIDLVEPMPYTQFQAIIDDLAPAGWRNYWRGHHLTGLGDGVIDAYAERGRMPPSEKCQLVMFRHGGAVARVPDDAMAASHRDATYLLHPIAMWSDPADDARHRAWVDACSAAAHPFLTGATYLNFEPAIDPTRTRAGYSSEKLRRLTRVKDAWDPTNLFREGVAIPPSSRTSDRMPPA